MLELEKAQTALTEQATHDALSGLPNRILLVDRITQALALARRSGQSTGLLFIDLDRFKLINDTRGHATGDSVLRQIAQRLLAVVRPMDSVSRLGGDEFAIIADGAPPNTRPIFEQRLADAVQESNEKVDRKAKFSLSTGILMCEGTVRDLPIEELLAQADALMYEQKEDHKKRQI